MREIIVAFGLFLFIEGFIRLISLKNEKYVREVKVDERLTAKIWRCNICISWFFNHLVYESFMRVILKKYFTLILLFSIATILPTNSQDRPASFADLAEKLMPSVVNISTTTTVVQNTNPFPFEFPPGSPFGDMFKEFGSPQKRKASALGSGFVIDSNGTVITNNHVIKGAEDIVVRFSNDKEYKAEIIGADPLSDVAVLKIKSDDRVSAC